MGSHKIWMIKSLADEHLLDELDSAINTDLINADLRTYQGEPSNYTEKRYHPTKDEVAASFKINKVAEWAQYIINHVSEDDLVELPDDWEPEIS